MNTFWNEIYDHVRVAYIEKFGAAEWYKHLDWCDKNNPPQSNAVDNLKRAITRLAEDEA